MDLSGIYGARDLEQACGEADLYRDREGSTRPVKDTSIAPSTYNGVLEDRPPMRTLQRRSTSPLRPAFGQHRSRTSTPSRPAASSSASAMVDLKFRRLEDARSTSTTAGAGLTARILFATPGAGGEALEGAPRRERALRGEA